MMKSDTRRLLQGMESLEDRRMMAIDVSLVADINAGPADSVPRSGTNLNGTLFFTAKDKSGEKEIWRLNNATGGVALLTDLPNDRSGSHPFYLVNVNGTLFFDAAGTEGDIHPRLWKSDGTAAGTTPVAEDPRQRVGAPFSFNGALLYYHPVLGEDYVELWRSDGGAGTMKLSGIDSPPNRLRNVAGTMFFDTEDYSGFQNRLWKTDGTPEGTAPIKDFGSDNVADMAERNGLLYLGVNHSESASIYKSNGTAGGTQPVVSFPGDHIFIGDVANINGTLYFTVFEPARTTTETTVVSLWKSDGSAAGTVKVTEKVQAGQLTNVNGTLWFIGNDAAHGREIWTSDGTEAGTTLFKDINPGAGDGVQSLGIIRHTASCSSSPTMA